MQAPALSSFVPLPTKQLCQPEKELFNRLLPRAQRIASRGGAVDFGDLAHLWLEHVNPSKGIFSRNAALLTEHWRTNKHVQNVEATRRLAGIRAQDLAL